MSEGSDQTVTRLVQQALKKRFGEKAVPLADVKDLYKQIFKSPEGETLRSLAQKTGGTLRADLMITGTVWRYKERIGGAAGIERPASVAFILFLIDVNNGKLLWTSTFDKTQRSLSEDFMDFRGLFKEGARWLTAEELARHGVQEAFKKFPI